MENCILFDWVSITSRIHSAYNIIELLGLQDVSWEEKERWAHGYRFDLIYQNIHIHYGPANDDMPMTWLEMTGQGCRAFESFGNGDYGLLFAEVQSEPDQMNITRLDIAYDDHDGVLSMKEIEADTRVLDDDNLPVEYVSKFRKREIVWSHDDGGEPALTVYHGRKGSDTMIRIYDKAAERGFGSERHWVRVELQLRDERARAFAMMCLDGDSIGDLWQGVIYNYLRYVEPDDFDSNRWRWPLKSYWANMLEDAKRIRLYKKPGTEYNMMNLENFVFGQAGNAIDTYIRIKGECSFMEALKNRPNKHLKSEYLRLIRDSEKGWPSESYN